MPEAAKVQVKYYVEYEQPGRYIAGFKKGTLFPVVDGTTGSAHNALLFDTPEEAIELTRYYSMLYGRHAKSLSMRIVHEPV